MHGKQNDDSGVVTLKLSIIIRIDTWIDRVLRMIVSTNLTILNFEQRNSNKIVIV